MSERSYIRQQPRWLLVLKIRQERAEWDAKAQAAQTWQERALFNQANGGGVGLVGMPQITLGGMNT